MEDTSKLLSSIAAILAAIAWPVGLIVAISIFRKELRAILKQVPLLIERVKKASLPGVQLELEQVASLANDSKSGAITAKQVEAANRIVIQRDEVGQQALLSDLDRLCLEYDALRKTMTAGPSRTQAMTRVLVKMRVLAPALIQYIDVYKGSPSAGSRLAAIAMMQMSRRDADINWLKDRFWIEQPFLFYHAALALEGAANVVETGQARQELFEVAEQARKKVKSFEGTPDLETLGVLDTLINSLNS